ncbi:MAG: Holliday junction resolvase RuvX [Actinomycetota bacterium]
MSGVLLGAEADSGGPAMSRVVLGIDPGSRRIGVAASDSGGTIALPVSVVQRVNDSYLDELVKLAVERRAVEMVVGLPRKLDGTDGPEAVKARALAHVLGERLGIPVHMVDERFTTRISEGALRSMEVSSRKQRGRTDGLAATVLLQGFLDARRSAS